MQVGNPSANVEAALLTIDLSEAVVDEAVSRGCDLIISHHPLLFRGLKSVCGRTPQERIVEKAIRHNIAIYSSHTAMDCYLHGVSGRMAEKLGITDYRILSPSPAAEAAPSPHGLEREDYHGLGVIGEWNGTFEELLSKTKEVFHAPVLRYIPTLKPVHTVALCGGAAAEFIDVAIAQGADVYISADMKYHEMQAAEGRIGLIDLDHWHSEQFTREIFAELLEGKVKTYIAETDKSPIKIY